MAFGAPNNLLGRVGPAGGPQYTTDTGGDAGFGIVLGQDGAYWAPRFPKDSVGRLTPTAATPRRSRSRPAPARAASRPEPNNTLWVTLETTKQIARISGVTLPPAARRRRPGAPGAASDTVKPRLAKLKVDVAKRRAVAAPERGRLAARDHRAARVRQAQGQEVPGAEEGSPRQALRALRQGALAAQGGQGRCQHGQPGQEAQARPLPGVAWWPSTRPATGRRPRASGSR